MAFERIITVGLNPTIDRVMEVPGLRVGEHVKGKVRSLMPAGKAFNVSRAMAALGVGSRAMGFLGRESLELFNFAARVAGIETDWTPIHSRTRENLTLVDPIASTATHIRDVGPAIGSEDLQRIIGQLEAVSRPGTLLVFCGSLPPGVTPQDCGNMIDHCVARGAAVAVDTSGEALRRAAESKLWLVKPNREELGELLGGTTPSLDEIVPAGRELAQRFPVVLITSGSDGAFAFSNGKVCRARIDLPTDAIRSTVGCGDTFLAGFIAAHQQGLPTETALAHAAAVAAASALSDMPASFAEQDRLMLLKQVQLDVQE